ncbi:hypothetical protein GJ632_00520 [Halogeometricum sp. CBA1124]|nr:hypothetical protein [Halogeometricum sp. CBA1124]
MLQRDTGVGRSFQDRSVAFELAADLHQPTDRVVVARTVDDVATALDLDGAESTNPLVEFVVFHPEDFFFRVHTSAFAVTQPSIQQFV